MAGRQGIFNMFKSLKFRITITAFLIISVIMSVSAWRDIKKTERVLLEVRMEKAALLSERIAHGIMTLMLNNRWQDLQVFMESLAGDSRELRKIRIFNPESGLITVSSSPKEIGAKTYSRDIEMFRKQETQSGFLSEKNDRQYASNLTVIRNQPVCYRCHGPGKEILGVLGIDLSLSDVYESTEKFKKEHIVEALTGFLLMGGGFLLVVGLLIDRPIRRMTGIIRRIENGDLSARMEEGKKGEFGLMAKSFNSMLDSLESAKKEIEMCHSEQMQRAAKLATLGEIVSGIAHEIKNPLTGISCAVQVIQSEMSEDDSRRAVTAEILNHIKRLDSTVKDLLNYAKPKPPHFQPLKINDILDKAVFFVYPEAKKHNVVIDAATVGEIPDVMVDPDQMQQVFLNLMINAVQAMPDGGKLKITTSKSGKDWNTAEDKTEVQSRNENTVIIRFEDTGKGMESDCIDSIFEPFFTKKSKGTGLGLSISLRIMQEHGGDIAVRSEPGRGSVFTLYLPAMKGS